VVVGSCVRVCVCVPQVQVFKKTDKKKLPTLRAHNPVTAGETGGILLLTATPRSMCVCACCALCVDTRALGHACLHPPCRTHRRMRVRSSPPGHVQMETEYHDPTNPGEPLPPEQLVKAFRYGQQLVRHEGGGGGVHACRAGAMHTRQHHVCVCACVCVSV
jgi:hypothetical protein